MCVIVFDFRTNTTYKSVIMNVTSGTSGLNLRNTEYDTFHAMDLRKPESRLPTQVCKTTTYVRRIVNSCLRFHVSSHDGR